MLVKSMRFLLATAAIVFVTYCGMHDNPTSAPVSPPSQDIAPLLVPQQPQQPKTYPGLDRLDTGWIAGPCGHYRPDPASDPCILA